MTKDDPRSFLIGLVKKIVHDNPAGVTLGLIHQDILARRLPDLKNVGEQTLYHRLYRVMKELEEESIVRKDGTRYYFITPKERLMSGVDKLLESISVEDGADLEKLRAAFGNVIEKSDIGEAVAEARSSGKKLRKPGSALSKFDH